MFCDYVARVKKRFSEIKLAMCSYRVLHENHVYRSGEMLTCDKDSRRATKDVESPVELIILCVLLNKVVQLFKICEGIASLASQC